MKVLKVGGSSVATAKRIKRFKQDVIDTQSGPFLLVVSGPGARHDDDIKVTDLLYAGDLSGAFNRFADISSELGISLEVPLAAFNTLNTDRIDRLVKTKEGRALLASRGEAAMALLTAHYLGWKHLEAAECIFINDGRIDKKWTKSALRKHIDSSKNYVIGGFYGSNAGGNIETFSRGGSNVTAAYAAKFLKVKELQYWSDTSLRAAHPLEVDNPHHIECMTPAAAVALCQRSQMMHPDAILPPKCDIIVGDVNNPWTKASTNPKTVISRSIDRGRQEGLVKIDAIASLGNMMTLRAESPSAFGRSGFGAAFFKAIEDHKIPYDCEFPGLHATTVAISEEAVTQVFGDHLDDFSSYIQHQAKARISSECGRAVISLIGSALAHNGSKTRLMGQLFTFLAEEGVQVHAAGYGTDSTTILFVVDNDMRVELVNKLYKRFIA